VIIRENVTVFADDEPRALPALQVPAGRAKLRQPVAEEPPQEIVPKGTVRIVAGAVLDLLSEPHRRFFTVIDTTAGVAV
jgi:hypothetical protein